MTFFPRVERWVIQKSAIHDSFEEMAMDGSRGNEGIVLWLGNRRGGTGWVTHLIRLRGPGVIKKPRLLVIESHVLNSLTDLTKGLGVALLGQIHSHKGNWVHLSATDRMHGVGVPYYLSIVAPCCATRPNTSLYECGVHVFEPGIGFRRFSPEEISRGIQLIDGGRLPMLTVGEEKTRTRTSNTAGRSRQRQGSANWLRTGIASLTKGSS